MFTVNPQPSNLRFQPAEPTMSEIIIDNQKEQIDRLRAFSRKLHEELAEAKASKEEYQAASVALSKQLAESMRGHRKLHEEKDALFAEVCSLRRQVGVGQGRNRSPFAQITQAMAEESTTVSFRLKTHAWQSQKLQGALFEVWPALRNRSLEPDKDLQMTVNIIDFVKFLIARDAWGANNSWKDLNVRFDKPRKCGPVQRINLT